MFGYYGYMDYFGHIPSNQMKLNTKDTNYPR